MHGHLFAVFQPIQCFQASHYSRYPGIFASRVSAWMVYCGYQKWLAIAWPGLTNALGPPLALAEAVRIAFVPKAPWPLVPLSSVHSSLCLSELCIPLHSFWHSSVQFPNCCRNRFSAPKNLFWPAAAACKRQGSFA